MIADPTTHDVLCDVHFERMSPRRYRCQGLINERTFSVCDSEGCARHFAPSLGYIDMVDGKIDQTELVFRHCEKSSIHGKMSEAVVRVQDGVPVWECLYCLATEPHVKVDVRQIA